MANPGPSARLDVTEGTLAHNLPYLALGSGRPLVFLRWFTPDHANPTGWMRTSEIKTLRPLARHFRVYAVNRAPGTPAGTTMADIADQHAEALHKEFGEPVDVIGVSSGGSVALQLAADHPEAVRRLVVVSAGYRLEPHVRQAQLNYARAVESGRRGMHHIAGETIQNPVAARLVAAVAWLLDPLARPHDPAATAAFIRAEDAFDLTDRLGEISAPTLVLGGDKDAAYPVRNLEFTAAGIPGARARVYPGASHMGAIKDPRLVADVVDFLTD
ncbi:alpha/beta fold hydrolase [Nocardia otitidiscaviarum]|uniref:alpha/beta fold hydrolase n=1 Tax=Nocardia otitidiscaviarum TaxID=1823 RepID=UPI002454FB12|nr:alpha/beta fold hydrolase [Nocardia otitidiscaviarum]